MMEKCLRFLFVFMFVVLFVAVPGSATAGAPPPQKTGVAPGDWEASAGTFTVVPQYTLTIPAADWLQLLTDGITITAPATICHEFRGKQFGWVGEIRKLEGDKWIKLVTTTKWTPDTEGKLMACAFAPDTGTYALFGYFDVGQAPVQSCAYDTSEWGLYISEEAGGLHFWVGNTIDELPEGTFVSYTVISMNPSGAVTGAMSGNGTVGNLYEGDADFLGYIIAINPGAISATLRISAAGCSTNLTIYFTQDT